MIVKMLHADVLSLSSEKEQTLHMLHEVGAVHLDFASVQGSEAACAKSELADAETAVQIILRSRGKNKVEGSVSRGVSEVLEIQKTIDESIAALEDLKNEISQYEPYGDFDPELAKKILDAGVDISSLAELPKVLPRRRLSAMRNEAVELQTSIARLTSDLANTDERAILAKFPDLSERLAFASAKELMLEKGSIAIISGWVPQPAADELRVRAS